VGSVVVESAVAYNARRSPEDRRMTSSSGQGTAARTHSLAPEHLGEVQAGAALTIAILGVAIFIAGIGVVVGGLTAAGSFDPANPPPNSDTIGTWQTMAAAWPSRGGDPFADRMNGIRKYVVSETLTDVELTWNNTTRIPGESAIARIHELHETEGGDLVVMGSATLVRTLLREGLVDELRLLIEPVLLGGGKTIYPDDGALRRLELVSSVTSEAGVHVCVYRPVSV